MNKTWQQALVFVFLQLAVATLSGGTALAEKHALLIGIGEYAVGPLAGPIYDVELLAQTLQQLGFSKSHIATLVNSQASKQAMIDALDRLETTTSAGDFIFIYFSGHGTSRFDPMNRWSMSPLTGALVPADFKATGTAGETESRLFIGNRDLRPRLTKLEKGRDVLVAFDSCYSGTSVRSIVGNKTYRYLPVKDSLALDDLESGGPAAYGSQMTSGKNDDAAYPYQRVMYLAASSPMQLALDIGWPAIRNGTKTVDGKPHGAFTDALIRAMQGEADGNHDKRLSLNEIFCFVKEKFPPIANQTPQLLKADSVSGNEPLFTIAANAPAPASTWMTDEKQPLRVEAKGLSAAVQTALQKIPGTELVTSSGDLLLAEKNSQFEIYLKSGALLCRVDSANALVARITSQLALRKLTRISAMPKAYNVFLNIAAGKGVLTEGEEISVDLTAEKKSFLLLFNVNPGGQINIVHPFYEKELAIQDKISLPDMGKVAPPHFGTEQMVAVAFRTEPPFWRELPAMAKRGEVEDLPPTAPLVEKIMQAVNSQAFAGGTVVSLQSTAKADIVRQ